LQDITGRVKGYWKNRQTDRDLILGRERRLKKGKGGIGRKGRQTWTSRLSTKKKRKGSKRKERTVGGGT